MPEFTFANDDLKVEPAAPNGWTFAAGDTIIGTVVRRSPLITPAASLKLFFRGNIKVVMDDDPRYNPPTTSSPATQFGRCAVDKPIILAKEGLLFEGPLHIQHDDEPKSWPFQFQIPLAPDIATKTKTKLTPLHDALCRGPLPGSFLSAGRGHTSCWIEYYLDAQLHYTHGGGTKTCKSTYLIRIRPPLGPEFGGFGSQTTKFQKSIQSYHLIPGLEERDFSFKQKKRQFFNSSKIPRFDYIVELTIPKTIPLDNPAPLPLEVRACTLPSICTIPKDKVPKIWLTGIKASLKSKTAVAIDGGDPDFSWGYQVDEEDLGLQKVLSDFPSGEFQLEIPVGERSQPLDFGQIFQLSLYSRGLKSGEKHLNRTKEIKPDFDAKYIKHSHILVIDITVTVAKRTERMWWEWPVAIT